MRPLSLHGFCYKINDNNVNINSSDCLDTEKESSNNLMFMLTTSTSFDIAFSSSWKPSGPRPISSMLSVLTREVLKNLTSSVAIELEMREEGGKPH